MGPREREREKNKRERGAEIERQGERARERGARQRDRGAREIERQDRDRARERARLRETLKACGTCICPRLLIELGLNLSIRPSRFILQPFKAPSLEIATCNASKKY